jgi:hypothetical protein
VLPSAGLKRGASAVGRDEGDARTVAPGTADFADAGERDAGDGTRDGRGGRSSEEEFVVLAAMEGGLHCGFRGLRASERVQREVSGFDLGGDVRGGAEVREVGREAVGEIDAG